MWCKKKMMIGLLMPAFLLAVLVAPTRTYARNPFGCDFFAAEVITDNAFIAVGDRGKIFLTTDAGKTFTAVESNTKASLSAVRFPDASQGWIVGQGGVILHSANGGKTWVPQSSGVDKYLMAVDFLDVAHGCAVGADSTVIVTSDGGKTWTRSDFTLAKDVGGEYNLFAVKMLGPGSICMTGDMGRIFLSPNAGKTWSEAASPLFDKANGEGRILYALASSAGTLLAIGIDGSLIISHDNGKTWIEGASATKEPEYFSLACVDAFGFAVGSGGTIQHTGNGGATWQVVKVPEKVFKAWLSGIALKKNAAEDIVGLVVGQYGTVGVIKNNQIVWQ
jgi:hypothetical protein